MKMLNKKTLEKKENRLLKQIKAKPIDFMITLLIVTNKIFI